jgi:hypothetical protein
MNDEVRRLVDLIDAGQTAPAEAWAQARAQAGDADAQFLMGYRVFGATRVDFQEACAWLRRAAAQDHAEALFQLSRIDQTQPRANSGPPRTDEMRAYLRRAADLGSREAQTTLASCLATGRGGFPKDEPGARAWYAKAAAAGGVEAQSSLGSMLLEGEGGPVAVDEGLALLERAAANVGAPGIMDGFRASEALRALMRVYEHGIPGAVAPDPAKVAELERRSAQWTARYETEVGEVEDAAVSTESPGERRSFGHQDPAEARDVLRAHMAAFRARTYKDLAVFVNRRLAARLRGPSGAEYDVRVDVRWEDQPLGPVDVSGEIDDHGWRSCRLIYEIFAMSPEGEIVGDSFNQEVRGTRRRRPRRRR